MIREDTYTEYEYSPHRNWRIRIVFQKDAMFFPIKDIAECLCYTNSGLRCKIFRDSKTAEQVFLKPVRNDRSTQNMSCLSGKGLLSLISSWDWDEDDDEDGSPIGDLISFALIMGYKWGSLDGPPLQIARDPVEACFAEIEEIEKSREAANSAIQEKLMSQEDNITGIKQCCIIFLHKLVSTFRRFFRINTPINLHKTASL